MPEDIAHMSLDMLWACEVEDDRRRTQSTIFLGDTLRHDVAKTADFRIRRCGVFYTKISVIEL